ncbi:DUF3892 domain-containing protein [Microbacterium paraoxydans]|uniref:DUF3892 domain-containing protein n=1 Tax=Microbacterium paraoxydans TaxID=199592 RepID=UPI00228684F3|nr:DUF3892 domain-containing protein [Microbacterium paraoxydans]MCZ0710581.1 DUF3892 domain-containing protein [Microbacterium paraoxydans]
MSIQITHVRYSGYEKTHQTIVRYRWANTDGGATGDNDKPSMVAFVDGKKNTVVVGSGSSTVQVGAVHPDNSEPYLRTYADGQWNNNLLSLPTF